VPSTSHISIICSLPVRPRTLPAICDCPVKSQGRV
jgi:hypothetical protein